MLSSAVCTSASGLVFQDFLFGLREVAAVLCHQIFLLAGIEFQNDVALFHAAAGMRQPDNSQGGTPADGGSSERAGLRGFEQAVGGKAKLHVAAERCRRERRRRSAPTVETRHEAEERERMRRRTSNQILMGFCWQG